MNDNKLFMIQLTPDALLLVGLAITNVAGMVVSAPNATSARAYAASYARQQEHSSSYWLNESLSSCEELTAGVPGVYLANFV